MHRACRLLPVPLLPLVVVLVVLALVAVLAGCAKAKAKEDPAPAPDPSASAATATATATGRAPAVLLCSDGLHRRGDHWKVDCNPCRCAADGDIVCSQFPCAAADAGARDAAAR
jgi:hypothetical protein